MVRFVEEAPNSSARSVEKAKLNSDKTIDQKPKKSGTVFFLKTLPDELPLEVPFNEPNEDEESDPENGITFYEYSDCGIGIIVFFFYFQCVMCRTNGR